MGFAVKMGVRMLKGRQSPFLRMTRTLETAPEPTGTFVPSWLARWTRGRTTQR
jgi:hypothetical protein